MEKILHPRCSFPFAEVQQHAEAELGSLAKEDSQEMHPWEVLGVQANDFCDPLLSSVEWGDDPPLGYHVGSVRNVRFHSTVLRIGGNHYIVLCLKGERNIGQPGNGV